MSTDEKKRLDEEGVFLQLFGREEYKTLYATKVEDFEQAHASRSTYVCALFVPGIDLFFSEAIERGKEHAVHAVFIDLSSEEERIRRLEADNNRDKVRFNQEELANWRGALSRSKYKDRFLMLDSLSDSPEALTRKTIEHFKIAVEALSPATLAGDSLFL